MHILCLEATHAIQHGVFPRRSLTWFLLSAFIHHGSLGFQEAFNSIATGRTKDADGEAALGLLKSAQPAFDKWQSRIQQDPNGCYIRFDSDRRASLIQISSEVPEADIGNQGSSVLSHHEREFDTLPDCEIRKMILRHDFEEMKRHRAVFVNTGRACYLRGPYWAVALATDEPLCLEHSLSPGMAARMLRKVLSDKLMARPRRRPSFEHAGET